MRQAITTKYVGPTNTKGSRIVAKADAGKVTVAYDHKLGIEANHHAAAEYLANRLGWSGKWHGGGLPGSGYVFVLEDGLDGFTIGEA